MTFNFMICQRNGIGRGTAKMLAKCGAEVFALSRTQADLDSLKQEVPSINTICVDLGDQEKTQSLVEAIGPIDLLVNNAAIASLSPFLEVTAKSFTDMMDINVRAVIQVSQIAARTMIARGCGGSIVNVSSQASLLGLTGHTVYSATKAAVDSLTKTMVMELGPHKIRVNSVNPTVVLTDMGKVGWSDPKRADPMKARIPLGRFAEVDEVVSAIVFMLSDHSAMVNGTVLPIDGGFLAVGL
ncbi:L-xylulose reductase-like isoform X2 [Asterias rubens]|uniref:L-xylulose reductase-like isoform X2 n=1 Tax=Asterias rubens TaxID=7604 RepID=UPI0014556E4B|nr:L-xylulose reductase-like isoform X2 [Asterias rubens]